MMDNMSFVEVAVKYAAQVCKQDQDTSRLMCDILNYAKFGTMTDSLHNLNIHYNLGRFDNDAVVRLHSYFYRWHYHLVQGDMVPSQESGDYLKAKGGSFSFVSDIILVIYSDGGLAAFCQEIVALCDSKEWDI